MLKGEEVAIERSAQAIFGHTVIPGAHEGRRPEGASNCVLCFRSRAGTTHYLIWKTATFHA